MWLQVKFFLCYLIALLFLVSPLHSQEQVIVGLEIKDAKFEIPRFEAPAVRYELRQTDRYRVGQGAILEFSPIVRKKHDRYVYGQWPIDKDDAIRFFAHFVIDGLQGQDFVPVNPFLMRVQLSSERTSAGPVVPTVSFDSRASIALLYKRQVNDLVRVARPSEEQNLSTYSAALSAISLSPKLDNYLLLARALKHSLRTGNDASFAPLSLPQFRALPGFGELSFEDQWTFQTEILDTLTSVDDLFVPIDRTRTVVDAALSVGDNMLGQLDFTSPEHTRLPIVRVFQTLSYLHSQNEDCLSLQDNNEKAIQVSDKIDMGWAAQRTLLLDWGNCLEQMTGFGSGPAESQLISIAAESAGLRGSWERFSRSAVLLAERIELSTGKSSERVRSLILFSNAVTE